MADVAMHLIGTILETEDQYGTCTVRIDWPASGDFDHVPSEGRFWLPIPDRVEHVEDIPMYEGRRVEVTVALLDGDGRG